jgi:hypothetical protein
MIAMIIHRLSSLDAFIVPIIPNIKESNGNNSSTYNVMLAIMTHCSIEGGLEKCINPFAYLSKLYIHKRFMMPHIAETIEDDLYVNLS